MWVGFLYTIVLMDRSRFCVIKASRKASWLLVSVSSVNWMLGCIEFRWWWKSSISSVFRAQHVLSTYLFQNRGGGGGGGKRAKCPGFNIFHYKVHHNNRAWRAHGSAMYLPIEGVAECKVGGIEAELKQGGDLS